MLKSSSAKEIGKYIEEKQLNLGDKQKRAVCN